MYLFAVNCIVVMVSFLGAVWEIIWITVSCYSVWKCWPWIL